MLLSELLSILYFSTIASLMYTCFGKIRKGYICELIRGFSAPRRVPFPARRKGAPPKQSSLAKHAKTELFVEMQLADRASLRDGVGQVQLQAGRLSDPAVTVHGDVAELRAGLVRDPELLPRGKQRAVMELDL